VERLAQGRAKVAEAEAALTNARDRYERAKKLIATQAITQQDYDDAEAGYQRAAAAHEAADQAMAELQRGARAQERASSALATRRAEAALDGARRAVPNAETGLAQGMARARMQHTTASAEALGARAGIEGAEASLEAARATEDLLRSGTREERIAQAAAGVRQAQAKLSGAEAALGNATQAYDDRIGGHQQRESVLTQLEVAEAQRAAASADLDLLLAGHTEEAIDNVRGQVRQAGAALERAKLNRDEAEIRAPCAGTVTETIADPGEIVAAGATVLTMVDLDHMWVKVYLPVTALDKVKVGNAAKITVDGAPDRSFPGEVLSVAQEAEFTPKNVQTVELRVQQVFWVKVGATDHDGVLKPGMPADAHF
jgi:HlyD family secretion protein